jgi:hypothetical protein
MPEKQKIKAPLELVTTAMPAPTMRSRVTLITNAYCQLPGEDPKQLACAGDIMLDSEEDAYERTVMLPADGSPVMLSMGGISSVLGIMFVNRTGVALPTIPSEEERKVIDNTVIEVHPFGLMIPVGLSNLITIDLGSTQIYARSLGGGTARLRYMVLPK